VRGIMKQYVTISSKWNTPEIITTVTNEDISLTMDLKDFIEALKEELDIPGLALEIRDNIDSVTWVFTRNEYNRRFWEAYKQIDVNKRIVDAIGRIMEGVKKESAKVMV
jgi:hypothetical protein